MDSTKPNVTEKSEIKTDIVIKELGEVIINENVEMESGNGDQNIVIEKVMEVLVNEKVENGSGNEEQDILIEKLKEVIINENGSGNEEQNIVIERLEKILNLLKGEQIKKEALVHIKKPLDDLESSLNSLLNSPYSSLFNDIFPTEIKEEILSYLCDSNAFVAASVCQEWKTILKSRFSEKNSKKLKIVELKAKEVPVKIIHNNVEKMASIAQYCSKCEDNECLNPDMMMKAAAVNKLDVHLVIAQPITKVDSKVITDGLTSVSSFTLSGKDVCWSRGVKDTPILSIEQLEHLFEAIEKGDKIMEEVKLKDLDLKSLNQEKLASCFVNKIKKLTLDEEVGHWGIGMLNSLTFAKKLQQDSVKLKLSHLTLRDFGYYDFQLSNDLGNALRNVKNVRLSGQLKVGEELITGLIENILQKPVRMKTLIVDIDSVFDYKFLINSQELKTVFSKMETLRLEHGYFTLDQLEAVRSLPDVEVITEHEFVYSIRKGSSEMF